MDIEEDENTVFINLLEQQRREALLDEKWKEAFIQEMVAACHEECPQVSDEEDERLTSQDIDELTEGLRSTELFEEDVVEEAGRRLQSLKKLGIERTG